MQFYSLPTNSYAWLILFIASILLVINSYFGFRKNKDKTSKRFMIGFVFLSLTTSGLLLPLFLTRDSTIIQIFAIASDFFLQCCLFVHLVILLNLHNIKHKLYLLLAEAILGGMVMYESLGNFSSPIFFQNGQIIYPDAPIFSLALVINLMHLFILGVTLVSRAKSLSGIKRVRLVSGGMIYCLISVGNIFSTIPLLLGETEVYNGSLVTNLLYFSMFTMVLVTAIYKILQKNKSS